MGKCERLLHLARSEVKADQDGLEAAPAGCGPRRTKGGQVGAILYPASRKHADRAGPTRAYHWDAAKITATAWSPPVALLSAEAGRSPGRS